MKPLVDAESAVQPLRAVIRGNEHRILVVDEIQNRGDFLVEVRVVIANDALERGARYVLPMPAVVKLPEPVLNTIESDFDELEVLPVDVRHEIPNHLKVLPRHLIDLISQPHFVVAAKSTD